MPSDDSADHDAARSWRGRPRAPDADRLIVEAALAEFGDRGWSGFTMDGVANRAQVGKSTLYLRWHDKETLLADAVRSSVGEEAAPDRGNLREDLVEFLVSLVGYFRRPLGWAAIRVCVDGAGVPPGRAPGLHSITGRLLDEHMHLVDSMLERAEIRGDLTLNAEAMRAVRSALYGAAVMHVLGHRHAEGDSGLERWASSTCDLLLDGLGHV
jgi:AcrR family transcriptional regulator